MKRYLVIEYDSKQVCEELKYPGESSAPTLFDYLSAELNDEGIHTSLYDFPSLPGLRRFVAGMAP